MAVITYVDDRYVQRDWKITPPIALLKTIDEYLSMPVMGDVLIIHGGQSDARDAAQGGRALLIEALLRVCKNGGRAIIFSGGQPMIASQLLRDELAREGFVEGEHYLLLSAIQNLWHEIDIELLTTSKVTSGWRISTVKRRHAAPTLLSLALLCQAALIASDPSDLDREVVNLLGGRQALDTLRSRCIPPSANRLFSPQPWQGSLGSTSAGSVLEAIEREWPRDAQREDGVHNLVAAVYDDPTALDAKTIADAYLELCRALLLNQELQQ
jgi:hypothetical protein